MFGIIRCRTESTSKSRQARGTMLEHAQRIPLKLRFYRRQVAAQDSDTKMTSKRPVEEVLDPEDGDREEVKRSRTGIAETMDTEADLPPVFSPPASPLESLVDALTSTEEGSGEDTDPSEVLQPEAEAEEEAPEDKAESGEGLQPLAEAEEAQEEEEAPVETNPQRLSFQAIYNGRFVEEEEEVVPLPTPSEELPSDFVATVEHPVRRDLDEILGRDLPPLPDIDSRYKLFPEYCTREARLIYERKKKLEEQYKVKENYLENTTGLTPVKRLMAANMIYPAMAKYAKNRETFHLALLILDRYYASGKATNPELFKIAAISAAYIAWKVSEKGGIDIRVFGKLGGQNPEQKEMEIVNSLDFDLGSATLPYFIDRFLLIVELEGHATAEELAMFLGDLAAAKYEFLRYSRSLIAAGAVYITHCVYNESIEYSEAFGVHSGYSFEQVTECVDNLVDLFVETREMVDRKESNGNTKSPIEVLIGQPQDVKAGMEILEAVARGSLGPKFGQFKTEEDSSDDSSEDLSSDVGLSSNEDSGSDDSSFSDENE